METTAKEIKEARNAGDNCACNPGDIKNSHSHFFRTPELTRAWEAGYNHALQRERKGLT